MKFPLRFDASLFFLLTIGFVVATAVGTVSHESGHYVSARLLNYGQPRIHYASTSMGHSRLTDLARQHHFLKLNALQKKALELRIDQEWEKYVTIIWWGPLQTMLTGSVGLLVLFWLDKRRPIRDTPLPLSRWLFIFIALFWLRQIANCYGIVALYALRGDYGTGDETRIASYYKIPLWLPNVVTAIVGNVVFFVVLFRFIPSFQRVTFILAGLCGGVLGFGLWMYALGPLVLP